MNDLPTHQQTRSCACWHRPIAGTQPTPYAVDYAEAAEYVGLSSVQALRDQVYKGTGPAHVKKGTRTLFRLEDLRVWIDQDRVAPLPMGNRPASEIYAAGGTSTRRHCTDNTCACRYKTTDGTQPAPYAVDYAEAARYVGLSSVQALRDHVYKGTGPAHVKKGIRTLFRLEDLRVWIDQDRVAPLPMNNRSAVEILAAGGVSKRRRGRPTKAEQIARQNRMDGAQVRS